MKSSTITAEVAMQHKILILDDHPLVRSGMVSLEETFPAVKFGKVRQLTKPFQSLWRNRQRLQSLISDCKTNLDCNMPVRIERERTSHASFSPPFRPLSRFWLPLTPAQLMHFSKNLSTLSHLLQRSTLPRRLFVTSPLLVKQPGHQSEGGYNPAEFTERENAIAPLVADGHSDTAIAEERTSQNRRFETI